MWPRRIAGQPRTSVEALMRTFPTPLDDHHPNLSLPCFHVTGAGLSCLIDQLAYTLFNPSEGILILRPYYAGFNRDFCKRNGVRLVGVTPPPTTPSSQRASQAKEHTQEAAEEEDEGEIWEGPDGLGQAFEMALKEAEDQGTKVILAPSIFLGHELVRRHYDHLYHY
jgi:hypothetical protein